MVPGYYSEIFLKRRRRRRRCGDGSGGYGGAAMGAAATAVRRCERRRRRCGDRSGGGDYGSCGGGDGSGRGNGEGSGGVGRSRGTEGTAPPSNVQANYRPPGGRGIGRSLVAPLEQHPKHLPDGIITIIIIIIIINTAGMIHYAVARQFIRRPPLSPRQLLIFGETMFCHRVGSWATGAHAFSTKVDSLR